MGIVVTDGKEYETYFRKKLYGEFDLSKLFINLKSDILNKPEYAWWGSPVNAEYGWREWSENNGYNPEFGYDFDKDTIKWKLEEGTKIYQVDFEDVDSENSELIEYLYFKDYDTEDARIYNIDNSSRGALLDMTGVTGLVSYGCPPIGPIIDFERMRKDGISAVELMNAGIGHYFRNKLEESFNSWDCESIVVLDKTKIIWL